MRLNFESFFFVARVRVVVSMIFSQGEQGVCACVRALTRSLARADLKIRPLDATK